MSGGLLQVDPNALSALSNLTCRGLERLRFHLLRCTKPDGKPVTIQFTPIDMRSGCGIMRLRLTMPGKGGDRLDSAITYDTGAEWSNSTLRVWGTHVPETIKMAAVGRPLGEVVAGAPVSDAIVLKMADIQGGTSLRCKSAKRVGLAPEGIDAHDGDDELLVQAAALRDVMVDPFAAAVLKAMDRLQAIHLLVHISQRESAQIEHVPVAYRRSCGASGKAGLVRVGADDWGDAIRMQLLKTGLCASMWVGDGIDLLGVADGHVFRSATLFEKNDTPSSVLGMEIKGTFGHATRSGGGDMHGQKMDGHRTTGEILSL